MKYSFERFTGKGSRTGGAWISYNKSGFLFSAGFVAKEKVSDYVILFYDKNSEAIGFLFTEDANSPGAMKVVRGNKNSTASVSSRSFIKANDLEKPELYGRKEPEKINYEEVGEMYVIRLKSAEKSNDTAPSADASIEEALPQ